MTRRALSDTALVFAALCMACSAERRDRSDDRPSSSQSASVVSAPSSFGSTATATSASASAAPTVQAPPAPYPEELIGKAKSENGKLGCFELVYKRGCAELRTGTVKLRVTLAPDGKPTKVVVVDNQIRRDSRVVQDCLEKNVPQWVFPKPEGFEPTFEMTLIFSDKC